MTDIYEYKYNKYKEKYLKLKEKINIYEEKNCNNSTEPPFNNEYFDKKDEGIYVDAVSGLPLFSSEDKFDSKTGWPSFRKPIDPKYIKFQMDKDGSGRIEVLSIHDCHLGHIFFYERPEEPIRYCMNSKALVFIPKEYVDKYMENNNENL
jgi:methionine-R-sulfoxide reductase